MRFTPDHCIRYIVQLEDGTIGKLPAGHHPAVGDTVTVHFDGPDGEDLSASGVVIGFVEVLEDTDFPDL